MKKVLLASVLAIASFPGHDARADYAGWEKWLGLDGRAYAEMVVETTEGRKAFCSAYPSHSVCAGYTYRAKYDTRDWGPPELVPLPSPRPAKLAQNNTPRGHADVEIPAQYRGAWCPTNWETIYKRCSKKDAHFIIDRTSWGVADEEGEECQLISVRKSRYGGHRLSATCQSEENPPYEGEERWWIGSNGTRLQK